MPKSSIESWMPSADSRSSTSRVRTGSAIIVDSVSSNLSIPGSTSQWREHRLHLVGEVGVEEVARGQVHGHRQAQAAAEEAVALLERLVHHAQGERHDQAGLLGERDERVRVDQAALGVLPAQQRLDRLDLAAAQVRLRLVVEDQLALLDRAPQLADQHHARGVAVVERLVVERVGRVALLGRVHGHVGPLEAATRRRCRRRGRAPPRSRPRSTAAARGPVSAARARGRCARAPG